MITEKEHFTDPIRQLIYISAFEDSAVKELKKRVKFAKFLNEIPDSLCEDLIPRHSIAVIDDMEAELTNNKSKTKLLSFMAFCGIRHRQLRIFVCLQSYNCFYKKSVLNSCLLQATHLCLFKSVTTFTSLKTWLNSYNIRLIASDKTLYDLFIEYACGTMFGYLLLEISPALSNARCSSQILLCEDKAMLLFSVE